MHGLINRSIQNFVHDTYGAGAWERVAGHPLIDTIDYEPLRDYPDESVANLVEVASPIIGQSREEFLEDLGHYLVSHDNCQNIRRLLRFGGDTFMEFLYSLPELRDRTRLAVEDLNLPEIHLREHFAGQITLSVATGLEGAGLVLTGILRALADDYGALVLIDHEGGGEGASISVQLLDMDYSQGRSFQLAGGM